MNFKNYLLTIVLIFGALCTGKAQNVYPNYIDGSVYFKIWDSNNIELAPYNYSNVQLNLLFAQYGVNVTGIRKPYPDTSVNFSLSRIYHMHCSDSTRIDSLIAKLKLHPYVEYAEKEPVMRTFYTPNDIHGNQWYLDKINATNAWNFSKGAPTVVIAIVDNAIRITHADLISNVWVNPGEIPNNFLDDDLNGYTDDINGYDIADNDNNPNPPPSVTNISPFIHGTHCAGIASASTDNGKGIASIGFNTKIMAVKCSKNSDDGNSLTNTYDGVYYAMRAKAKIISMSFGGNGIFATGQSVINAASQAGIILIASAGNSDSNGVSYPAAYQNVIAVGSTDIDDKKSSFSNYGSAIDLMAPGRGIWSTIAGDDNSYGYLSGTSMSAPMVAGLAALVKAANPGFSAIQVENALKAGCDNINAVNPNYVGKLGVGRINAYRTFKANTGIYQGGENSTQLNISVYPNPASGKIHYFIDQAQHEMVTVSLVNTLGQKVMEHQAAVKDGKAENTLDISGFSKGIYILEVLDDKGFRCKTVVIE